MAQSFSTRYRNATTGGHIKGMANVDCGRGKGIDKLDKLTIVNINNMCLSDLLFYCFIVTC